MNFSLNSEFKINLECECRDLNPGSHVGNVG